jgi:hypothetical protein
MANTEIARITLKRGSGRRIKRQLSIPKDALFYALAYGLFAELVVSNMGGKKRDWMSWAAKKAAGMLLSRSKEEIESWLFDNVLAGNLDGD